MDTTNYSIKKVSKIECESILKKHHYLGKQGYSFRSGKNYGLYKGDTLIGVAVFHGVSAWETVKGAFGLENKEQKSFWELGRLAIDPEHNEKNLGSWFVAKCIKLLRSEAEVRAIISYADTDFHTGGIYQALNFKYCGLTAPKKDFWIKQDDGTYKKASRGASSKNSTGEWRPRAENIDMYWCMTKNFPSSGKKNPIRKSPPLAAHLKGVIAMGRKKKLINNTNIPQYAIERFARCVFDDIRAAYENEEIQKEFAEWQAEQAAKKAELKQHKKARAANTAALVVYFSFFFPLGPRGFDSGRIFQPLAK